jgi:Fic family protein
MSYIHETADWPRLTWRYEALISLLSKVRYQQGREVNVHFEAPNADRLQNEMTRFLDWFESPLDMDPILKAGIAHFWFITVHPFEDGNGRIARAIADMALARADETRERFYSMSPQIELERKEYYWQLENCQRGTADITRWLTWFLECLDRSIVKAHEQVELTLQKARFWNQFNEQPVNDRQRKILNLLIDGHFKGKLTSSKYAKICKCSPDTALRDLKTLIRRGILIQEEGGGRSTSYRVTSCRGNKNRFLP